MKKIILKSMLLFLPFTLTAEEGPSDQFEFCFGGSYGILAKAMSMAQDHGYPYVKILSYELNANNEHLSYADLGEVPTGERFEFSDEGVRIEIVCFMENTTGCNCIQIDTYQEIISQFRIFEEEEMENNSETEESDES